MSLGYHVIDLASAQQITVGNRHRTHLGLTLVTGSDRLVEKGPMPPVEPNQAPAGT
jgi:hypothetical protein